MRRREKIVPKISFVESEEERLSVDLVWEGKVLE